MVVFNDRWSPMSVVFQDYIHCAILAVMADKTLLLIIIF